MVHFLGVYFWEGEERAFYSRNGEAWPLSRLDLKQGYEGMPCRISTLANWNCRSEAPEWIRAAVALRASRLAREAEEARTANDFEV